MPHPLAPLPPAQEMETKLVLKKAAIAHRYLAELKGLSGTIPNKAILINTLSLQEAKDSSSIENIITTQDELFKEELFPEHRATPAAKEVKNYERALRTGFRLIRKSGLMTANNIIQIQEELERNQAGIRKTSGTTLVDEASGRVVYTPPQMSETILALMTNLERHINDDTVWDADPLVKMAVIHHQFESIHPVYDGNGRTGRIINVLYLVLKKLLDIPVLYLSRHFIRTKSEYYQRLQDVRESSAWEAWIVYILEGVAITARESIAMIKDISIAYNEYSRKIKNDFRFFRQDLLNNLFYHPYTKIEMLERRLSVSRQTAAKYLEALANAGLVHKEKFGRSNYYINTALFNILTNDYQQE